MRFLLSLLLVHCISSHIIVLAFPAPGWWSRVAGGCFNPASPSRYHHNLQCDGYEQVQRRPTGFGIDDSYGRAAKNYAEPAEPAPVDVSQQLLLAVRERNSNAVHNLLSGGVDAGITLESLNKAYNSAIRLGYHEIALQIARAIDRTPGNPFAIN